MENKDFIIIGLIVAMLIQTLIHVRTFNKIRDLLKEAEGEE